MKPTRFEFTIKFGVDRDPSAEFGNTIHSWVELMKERFMIAANHYNKTFEVIDLKEIPPDESLVFFVLNGQQNGEKGVFAVTCDGVQLADGWYYLPHGFEDPPFKKPYDSRDEAEEALKKWKILENQNIKFVEME